ncbi:PIN domain-containing protein [Candidatus Bipolaricaulota bacterium]|nr:PIN domain-containing protein [Candidatus Bipolaricaulota bacterium]
MEEPTLYVLDTHVLIWYFIGSNRLRQKLKERIDKARRRGGRLLVPTIVLSEALDVAEKGRVELDFAGMYRLIREEPEFEIVGFGPDVFEETMRIREIQEIHERIIVATARFYEAGMLTKDRIIRDSGEVETL